MDRENGFDVLFLTLVYALVMLGLMTTVDILFTSSWQKRRKGWVVL